MFEDYIATREENAVLESELETLLNLITNAIQTESYLNPFGIMEYIKAVYPNRWDRRLKEIYAQDD